MKKTLTGLTVALLLCPAFLGAYTAFAETTDESSQTEIVQTEESTSNEEQITQDSDVVLPEASGETEGTGEQLPETSSSEAILPPEEQATEATTSAAPTLETEVDDAVPLKEYKEIKGSDIDRTALEAAFKAYSELNESDYTAESWKSVMEKINGPFAGGWSLWDGVVNYYNEGPNDTLGMDGPEFDDQGGLLNVLQGVRDMFANNVLSAIGELVKAPAPAEDITYYVMYVDENDKEIAPTVTKTGKEWQAATEKAIEIPGYTLVSDPELTQTLGDGLIFKFEYKKNDVTPPVSQLNLDALKAAIAAADPLKEADYTPESWGPFAEALTAAKDTLAKAEAQNARADLSQANVDAATTALTDAQAALVKKADPVDPTDPVDPKPDPGNNGNGSGNNGANAGNNGNANNTSGNGSNTGNNSGTAAGTNSGNNSGNQTGGTSGTVEPDKSVKKTSAQLLPAANEAPAPNGILALAGMMFAGLAAFFSKKRKHS